MTRGVSSANEAAMSSAVVRPVRFVELQFASGTVYVWSGAGNFSWNGHTWIGLGDLASCSPVEEGADLGSRSMVPPGRSPCGSSRGWPISAVRACATTPTPTSSGGFRATAFSNTP